MAEKFTYVAFYKPYGVITAFTDSEGHETLKEYIPLPGVYPVGRLDLDSEGLLLLTDDGPLAHRLTDPQFNHPKTYLVQVEGVPTAEALGKLESGVEVKGQMTRRAQVLVAPEPSLPERRKPVTPHGPTTWLRIVLREGKKRQIRHMTAAVGLPTLRLVRVALGSLSLGALQPGEWRLLNEAEIEALKQLVRGPALRTPKKDKPTRAARGAAATVAPQTTREDVQSSRSEQGKAKAGGKPARTPGNGRGSRYRNAGRRSSGR